MRMSDMVARYIMDILDEHNGAAEIKRNELATTLGCVPSQINYVITSRFTPEQGFIVESRRGGGGYIRITRINTSRDVAIMHIVNAIGTTLDKATAEVMIDNMLSRSIIDARSAKLMAAAMGERAYLGVPQEYRDSLRAAVFKNMLLTLIAD
ncbi:CtsR family transcriptional regulator [Ruminococcus sp.]|uniref:CtsR family transcriptional regulator n=1 Tax=Ruminococcus sp. TaxID=41978 RepID=UPI003866B6F2